MTRLEQETTLQLSYLSAALCFLLYFIITFASFSSISFFFNIPAIWDEQVTWEFDLFGYDYLTRKLANLISAIWPDMPKPRTVDLGWDISTGVVGLLLSLLIFVYSKKLIGCRISLGKWRHEAILWIFVAVFVANVFPAIFILPTDITQTTWSYFFGPSCAALLFRADDETPLVLLAYLFISPVIIAPISEEIAHRGLLGEIFIRSIGPLPAALFTSALFGIAHTTSWVQVLSTFVIGFFLFAARMRFGGILVPIFMHMGINAFVILPALYRC
jgi:membrane protease YdiL (CAAX protease family)